jgi:catechol 2,3-dioxygenase-like lactoylglutathione lyase family enzyme
LVSPDQVTYNYGVESYKVGSGLASFTLAVEDVQAATTAASAQGFMARNNNKGGVVVVGPDGYRFLLVPKQASSARALAEPFLAVKLHVADAARAAAFYTSVLGMAVLPSGLASETAADKSLDADDVALSFGAGQVGLVLRGTGTAPRVEQYEGRHAISLPAATLQAVYKRFEAEHPELVVHAIMELEETLGTLFIAIVKDLDGFEICLVSSETFDKAVAAAADFVGPDYPLRAKLVAERRLAAAAAKSRQESAKLVGVLGGREASSFVAPAAGAGPQAVAVAVAQHVWKGLNDGSLSKAEGNFFTVGLMLGAAIIALPIAFSVGHGSTTKKLFNH